MELVRIILTRGSKKMNVVPPTPSLGAQNQAEWFLQTRVLGSNVPKPCLVMAELLEAVRAAFILLWASL